MFKIDFEKVYERVNGDFLKLTLTEFRFPDQTIQLIMNCTMPSNLSLKWKSILESFTPTGDLRQGDHFRLISFRFAWKSWQFLFSPKLMRKLGNPLRFLEMALVYLPFNLRSQGGSSKIPVSSIKECV